jgi:hypothetical protein
MTRPITTSGGCTSSSRAVTLKICDPPFTGPSGLAIGGPDSRFGRYDQEIVASLRFGRPIRDSGPRIANPSIFRDRG